MRSAVSLALVTSLIATAVPVAARDTSPLATVQQSNPVDSQWSRVRKLAPGSEIIVTIEGAQPVERRVVRVDESSLTLSNGQVVERVARNDVAEIKTVRKGRGVWGHLGPLGGYFVGALSGGYGVGLACQAVQGRNQCDSGAFLLGTLMGGISGGLYGFSVARRETEEVIYGYRLVR